MLVGHTLYNDSSVVLRELIQNGLDAIKLQNEIEKNTGSSITTGKIIVTWDSKKRVLSFVDNGTGMTVYDIENYLLKVGTSKYSSASFKKEHPDFVSISRFGIGILTCFLVANDIEIITCASENNEANRIFFRNVDGKYLLKSLKKDELPTHIAKHGTMINLHLRDDANMEKLEFNIKRWIVFPYCEVVLIKDSSDEIKIGYDSPKVALEDYIARGSVGQSENIIVQQEEINGISIAYALRYREYIQEYSLIEYSRKNYLNEEENYPIPIGVCFEGIRVSDNTPGYRRDVFLAIMNSSNNKVVRTNVARSSIEDNAGRDELLKIIYSAYKNMLRAKLVIFKRKRSLSWIASETRFLVNQLFNLQNRGIGGGILEKRELMEEVFGDINAILYENNKKRKLISANLLQEEHEINMSESNMIDAAERLLKEAKSDISLSGLINNLTAEQTIDGNNLLCDYEANSVLHAIALKGKGIKSVIVNKSEKKIDLCLEQEINKWKKVLLIDNDSFGKNESVYIPIDNEVIQGLEGELGVKTKLGVFLDSSNEVTKYICEKLSCFDDDKSNIDQWALRMFISLVVNKQNIYLPRDRGQDYFEKFYQSRAEREILERYSENFKEALWSKIDRNEMMTILYNHKIVIYDLNDWIRRDREH